MGTKLVVLNTSTGKYTTIHIVDKNGAEKDLRRTIIGDVQCLPHAGDCTTSLTWREFLLGYFFDFISDPKLKADFEFSTWFTEELRRNGI